MEKKKEKAFRYGDKVYHHTFGWGNVRVATDKIVGINFQDGHRELMGDDLQLLSFTAYLVELIGFTQEPLERKTTWHSIWEDYCDEGYIGINDFLEYLEERYKLPKKI